MKKLVAALLAVLIVFSWYVTIFGVGPLKPLKDEMKLGLDLSGGVYVVMEAKTDATGTDLRKMMEQTQAIIENRVNQMGMSEPVVTIEGDNRIRVELPGADNVDEAIQQIGKTAQLQFVLADGRVALDGSQVKDAGVATDNKMGGYAVTLKFTDQGAKNFEEATKEIVDGKVTSTIKGVESNQLIIALDGDIISHPNVSTVISGGNAEITGNFTSKQASDLAILIRGGALPVELHQVQAGVTGATLGIGALHNAIVAGVIGIILILLLMLGFYRIMGFCADFALLLYIPLVLWITVMLRGVLTLPGIAGMILSIGMAVDCNVIIFSRIKEEVVNGRSIRVAVNSGFKRAMATVIDSQVTTFIAALVLYMIGSGSVKGFAMTLMIGILASLLTAVVVTRLYLELVTETKTFLKNGWFAVPRNPRNLTLAFMKYRKIFYAVSILLIVIGIGAGLVRGFNYGIDFTGGTMIQLDMSKTVASQTAAPAAGSQTAAAKTDDKSTVAKPDDKAAAKPDDKAAAPKTDNKTAAPAQKVDTAELQKILDENGIKDATITHAGTHSEQVIIRTTKSLANAEQQKLLSSIDAKYNLDSKTSLLNMEQFGPSVGAMIKTNALEALFIACLCMLIYIIVRFEWRFGIASVVDLLHDVLIMVAFYGLFQVPINNPFIAAILIIVGYSINDTIVVFDRIRENLHTMDQREMIPLVDHSVNQVLGRSIMTSATTVLVIIPLFILGNDTIREFTLPLLVGIVSGTVSSVTIASPLYLQLVNATAKKRVTKKYQGAEKKAIADKKALSEKKEQESLTKAAEEAAKKEKVTAKKAAEKEKAAAKEKAEHKDKKQDTQRSKRYNKNRGVNRQNEEDALADAGEIQGGEAEKDASQTEESK